MLTFERANFAEDLKYGTVRPADIMEWLKDEIELTPEQLQKMQDIIFEFFAHHGAKKLSALRMALDEDASTFSEFRSAFLAASGDSKIVKNFINLYLSPTAQLQGRLFPRRPRSRRLSLAPSAALLLSHCGVPAGGVHQIFVQFSYTPPRSTCTTLQHSHIASHRSRHFASARTSARPVQSPVPLASTPCRLASSMHMRYSLSVHLRHFACRALLCSCVNVSCYCQPFYLFPHRSPCAPRTPPRASPLFLSLITLPRRSPHRSPSYSLPSNTALSSIVP